MWISFFLNITISFIIIYLSHQLWEYLKNTFSTKVTKDLAGAQIQKYKQMIEEIQKGESENSENMEKELESFIESI
jgi:hypothetical protein